MADKKISALTASSTPLAGTEVLPIVQGGSTVKVAVSNLTAGRSVETASLTAVTTTSNGASTTVWDTGNSTFGPNATSPTGSALGVGFNTGTNASEIISLAPGVAWRKLALFSGGLDINSSNGSTAASFDTSGNQTLSTGNLVIGTSGKGIDFSATPGTGTSELLNDYEEGTWTPSVGGTATYTTQSGKYIRVGNAVSFNGRLKINSLGTGSAFLITGLPFTSSNDGIGSSVHIGIWAGLGTTPVYVSGYVYPNFAGFELQGTITGTATLSALSVLVNSAEVYFSGTYFV